MVGINKLTVSFIKGTDYLKQVKGLKHKEICDLIGIKRWQYDQIRIGRRIPSQESIKILTSTYKELSRFFEEEEEEEEEDNKDGLLQSLREVIAAKDEVIKMKDEKIKDLESMLEVVKGAHINALSKIYVSEEELDAEIEKRKKEVEELRNNNKG